MTSEQKIGKIKFILRFIADLAQLQLKSFVLRFFMHSINSALHKFCQNAKFEQLPFPSSFNQLFFKGK